MSYSGAKGTTTPDNCVQRTALPRRRIRQGNLALKFHRNENLLTRLNNFPSPFEPRGNQESVPGAHGLRRAVRIPNHGHTLKNLAVFTLGEVHRPLTASPFPNTRRKLPARTGKMRVNRLRGIAGEYSFRLRYVLNAFLGGL